MLLLTRRHRGRARHARRTPLTASVALPIVATLLLVTAPAAAAAQLDVDVIRVGNGRVVSQSGNLNCPPTCHETVTGTIPYDYLQPVDENGFRFNVWSSGCRTILPPPQNWCYVVTTYTTRITITAYFADVQAPRVSMLWPAEEVKIRGVHNLRATASDNDSIARLEWFVDGRLLGVAAPSGGEYVLSWATEQVPDGRHEITARGWDPTGFHTDHSRSVVVDNHVNPVQFVSPSPEDGAWTNAAQATFAWTRDADVSAANVACGFEAGSVTPAQCPDGRSATVTGRPEGDTRFYVRVTDDVGNSSLASRLLRFDRIPPQGYFESGPPENALLNGVPVFTFRADGTGSPVSVECELDGRAGACTTPASHSVGEVADGAHRLVVNLRDAAGNGGSFGRSFVLDTAAPALAVTGGPDDGATVGPGSVTFRFQAEPGARVECSLDSEHSFRPCAGTSSDTLSRLPAGRHIWRVGANDAAHNRTLRERRFVVASLLDARIVASWSVRGTRTRFTSLVVSQLPRDGRVRAACRGRGCPFAARTVVPRRGKVTLTPAFRGRQLAARTRVTIRALAGDRVGRFAIFTVRSGRAPLVRRGCLVPNAIEPMGCPTS